MIGRRRAIPARHEFRLGTRELVLSGAVFLLIGALTFVFGVLVGRGMAPVAGPGARVAARSSSPAEPATKPATGHAEERFTFYNTLTAPTPNLPTAGQPTVEERIVPTGERPASSEPTPGTGEASASAPPREPAARGRTVVGGGAGAGAKPTASIRVPAAATVGATPGGKAVDPESAEPQTWTVQVGSYRSRTLAEELRGRLATRGLDAYLVSAATEEGRVRHRVRVGAFPTRAEAEQVATELRAEQTLSPFVTLRPR